MIRAPGTRPAGAGGDRVPASVRRFAERARRRRLRAAAPWLVVLASLVLVVSCAGVVGGTGLFGVARITVVGATITTPDQIRTASAVPGGTPLVRVDTAEVASRVRTLAAVRAVTVSRKWPRTLVIRVVERTAVAVVPVGTGFVTVDPAGVVFQTLAQRPAALPLIRLAAPGGGDPTTRAAVTVLGALPSELRTLLTALVAEAPARIRLELADGRSIIWGDSTENSAKVRVALVLLTRPGKVLDVSAPNLVTVR